MDFHTGLFPKIEKTTFDVSVVHFLLMFGYKLFSLYYPLFLVSIGLSVMKVGWVYFLIYFTIALAAVAANFWIHKINPAKVASAGIFGYGVYALLMLINVGGFVFYAAQILLGISAALWLVSLKSIIIVSAPKNYDSSFGWFYSAPEYASALAPIVGGLVIYKFGFSGVFALSVFAQFANSAYAWFKLKDVNFSVLKSQAAPQKSAAFNLEKLKENYSTVFRELWKDKPAITTILVIFAALILGGIYRPYFVLFLKDINYTQNEIIGFFSLLSLVFIPLSWMVIRFIGKTPSFKNISRGIIADGIIFIIIGLWLNILNLIQVFFLLLADAAAGLMIGSGKSGFLAAKFSRFKEEASTIDTVLVVFGSALGGIIGGALISTIGFNSTFLLGGIAILFLAFWFLIMKH